MRQSNFIRTFMVLLFTSSFIIACGDSPETVVVTQTKWLDQEKAALDPGEPGSACAEDGAYTACYTGPAGTMGVGTCVAGKQWCINGVRTTCKKQVTPASEACDGSDNDCDGSTDEQLGQTSCGEGSCAVTVDNCVNGEATDCEFEAFNLAAPEACDGDDNDCDGSTDEDQSGATLTSSCYTGANGTEGVGLCHSGTSTCTDGNWGACNGEVTPATDSCDGLDNDCDDSVDEDFPDLNATCVVGTGACETESVYVCNAAANGVECGATAGDPEEEVCDGLDNDCDADTDENALGNPLTQSCYTGTAGTQGVGVCVGGNQTCTGGAWGVCNGQVTDTNEACDGLDNDCDADTDENALGNPLTQSCYTGTGGTAGVGECAAGSDVCHAGEFVGLCFNETTDVTEVCFNSLDDDCDGATDENCTIPCTDADGDGYGDGCSSGVDCDDTNASANPKQPEWCDNSADDDCDGFTDETGCASTADGRVLVQFEQTGTCAFTNLIFYTDFKSVTTPTTKMFVGDSSLLVTQWNYLITGGTDGLHRLNLEFDSDGFTGNELTFVVSSAAGPVLHDECGTLRLFYEGSEVVWTTLDDPRTTPTPFQEANVFACLGDAAGCFLCGGDWDDDGTPDCSEASGGQCGLHAQDTAACQ